MTPHLETIVELQRALDLLDDIERRLNEIPEWMRELHREHAEGQAAITAAEELAAAAAAERRSAEAATRDAQEKLKKYQQQINRVTNQREYGAILQEIDTAKGEVARGEEEGLSALTKLEGADGELATLRDSFRDLDERYATELAKWESEKPGHRKRATEVRGQVAALRERLPRGIAALYDRIRERIPGALAVVRRMERPGGKGPVEWHCGVCNYRVRPQIVVEIRNGGDLIQCDACKRILYVDSEST